MSGARHAGLGCHRRPPAGPAEAGGWGRALQPRLEAPTALRPPGGACVCLGRPLGHRWSLCCRSAWSCEDARGPGQLPVRVPCGPAGPRPTRPLLALLSAAPGGASCPMCPRPAVSPQGVCHSWDSGVSVAADRPLVGLEVFLRELARVMGSTQALLCLLPACTPLPSPTQTRVGRVWPGPVGGQAGGEPGS